MRSQGLKQLKDPLLMSFLNSRPIIRNEKLPDGFPRLTSDPNDPLGLVQKFDSIADEILKHLRQPGYVTMYNR